MEFIQTSKLLEYLEYEKHVFTIHGAELIEIYQVASLFEPIKNGFYFFKGDNFVFNISDSLILVEENFNITDNENSYLKISDDVQILYYKFLSYFFPNQSTGVINKKTVIHPKAKIGNNVQIDEFCIIGACEIGDDVIIHNHSKIHNNCFIGKNTTIESFSDIGTRGLAWIWNSSGTEKIIQPQLGGVNIGKNCILASHTVIVRGSLNENTVIGDNTIFAPGCRLGHGTKVGVDVHFANNVITGGNAKIGNYCFVGSSAVFRSKVIVDSYTIVGAGAIVVKNTSVEGLTLMGNPAREYITKENPNGMPKPNFKLKNKK